jgi:hypothetical protein
VYARSSTISAQPLSIDAGIAYFRDEVMPALLAMDGCVGVSLLVDRLSGRCYATSAWETNEAMRGSEERVRPVRDRATAAFGGSATVKNWEIAVLHLDHRSQQGACVRATWVRVPHQSGSTLGCSGRVDQGIEFYKSSMLPSLDDLEGFCSASLLIHRSTGGAVSSVTFDSRESMERSREEATELKRAVVREAGAEELDECEFELALARVRVPDSV